MLTGCRITQDLRPQDVAVKLLQQKNEYDKIQSFDRIRQHNEDRAWNRSDIRSEEWDYIRYSYDHADQHGIRHIQYGEPEKAQYPDNGGINNLSDNKAAE